MNFQKYLISKWLSPLLFLGASGCTQIDVVNPIATPHTQPLQAKLARAGSCGELLDQLQSEAKAHVELEAWYMAEARTYSYADDVAYEDDATTGAPENSASDGDSSPSSYTETNVQVEGVDEADYVETDGEHIYLLHGNSFYVLDSWPPSETSILSSIEIEGYTQSMFVKDGKASIFSTVYNYDDDYYYYSSPQTKVTIIDSTGETPTIESEMRIDGWLTSARRHDDIVRIILSASTYSVYGNGSWPVLWDSRGNSLNETDANAAIVEWRDARFEEIEEMTLSDFLPSAEIQIGEIITTFEHDCTSFFLPETGTTQLGFLEVATFDINDPSSLSMTTLVGRADTVYANADSLVVAQYDYRWDMVQGLSSQETALHLFAIDESTTDYQASGKITGIVNDQFSIDMNDDVIRVAVQEDQVIEGSADDWGWVQTEPVSRVQTLALSDDKLTLLGSTEDLAPGERIQSVRFIDDRAYVVTFRQVDPLFVINLDDPAAPTVVGELKIPGFSEYIHPLSDGFLLTVGRDATDDGSWLDGLSIQIFDVTDDASPALVHKLVISGSSSAEWDHHDFIYNDEKRILAIPIYDWTSGFSSQLALFDISIDDGISERGRIDHTSLFSDCDEITYYGYSACGYSAEVRRGLFIEDNIYSISYGGVLVHDINDLTTSLATVELPSPAFYDYYYYGEFVGD